MAEQHRRGYEGEFQQQGRGWSDRDDWRTDEGDEPRRRTYQTGPDDLDRERRWREQSEHSSRRYDGGRVDERPFGGYQGYQDGHYGQYVGTQYGGVSSRGRGYPESDFLPNRAVPSNREYGGGDWRTRGEWRHEPDVRQGRAPWYTGGAYSGGAIGSRENYSGRGPKDYKRSDDRIREDVSDRLEQDAFVDASDVTVDVRDGEVTLTGTVGTRQQKRAAEDCVETVSGVREVHNGLRVNRQSPSESSSSLLGLGGQPPRDAEAESPTAEPRKGSGKNADKT